MTDFELFDSVLFNAGDTSKIVINPEDRLKKIKSSDLKYPIPFDKIPKNFDPRTPSGVPPEDVDKWFYKNYDGELIPVSGFILDQATCGSCWGFASTAVFTDSARFLINKLYKDIACVSSPLFNVVFTCTGDTSLANGKPKHLFATQVRNGFSPYYTIGFSPKQTTNDDGELVLETVCQDAVDRWHESFITNVKPIDIHTAFGKKFNICQGCRGNSLEFPLMLFVNSGAPILSDFPIHEWICFFGSAEYRKVYCSPEYITGDVIYQLPPLYKPDNYSFTTIEDFEKGNKPPEVKSMSDWIMLTVYNYGSCMIGYNIYSSFIDFFRNHANRNNIYTADIFINDIINDTGGTNLGGHAVNIIGWGEKIATPNPNGSSNKKNMIQYWIVRNSWGSDWGQGGFFLIEREIDQKLEAGGYTQRIQFEDEFGALYYSPQPTSMLTTEDWIKAINNDQLTDPETKKGINDMKVFFQPNPNAKCIAKGQFPKIMEQLSLDCGCRCGYAYNNQTKQCENVTNYAGAGLGGVHHINNMVSASSIQSNRLIGPTINNSKLQDIPISILPIINVGKTEATFVDVDKNIRDPSTKKNLKAGGHCDNKIQEIFNFKSTKSKLKSRSRSRLRSSIFNYNEYILQQISKDDNIDKWSSNKNKNINNKNQIILFLFLIFTILILTSLLFPFAKNKKYI